MSVPEELEGERLDRCISRIQAGWSRSQVRRWIDAGRVTRNDQSARPADRVQAGDFIQVDVPDVVPAGLRPQSIPLSVIYEDAHLLVVNKQAGLVIHPAAGNPQGTLVNALLHYCSDLSGIGGVERPGIVHRLDRDTTGAIVVAKTDSAHLGLSLAFSRREVSKTYLAVCYGAIAETDLVIDAAVGRHAVDRKRMTVRDDGRTARTLVHVEERLVSTTLVSCRLITGRTHQIRVHLSHRGHAIVGDPIYSGRQWRSIADSSLQKLCRDFPRQALHAFRLEFTHPVTGARVQAEAPPPADLQDLVNQLRSSHA